MTLEEHLKDISGNTTIALCNKSTQRRGARRGTRAYNAFYVGEAAKVPQEAKQQEVFNTFCSCVWEYPTFILED